MKAIIRHFLLYSSFLVPLAGYSAVSLFKRDTVERKPIDPASPRSRLVPGGSPPPRLKLSNLSAGNLPSAYLARVQFVSEESPVVLPQTKALEHLKKLPAGIVLLAQVKESLVAFSDGRAPVRAEVILGDLRGAILLGEASLEPNSKRIVAEFSSIRLKDKQELWLLKGHALDMAGVLGVNGKLISGETRFFFAELFAAAAAGFADASIHRDKNTQGNYIEEPSLDTIGKKSAAAALNRTADRYSERQKKVPEYAVLDGPSLIQILVTEQPKLESR